MFDFFRTFTITELQTEDTDRTAPLGVIWSSFTLFDKASQSEYFYCKYGIPSKSNTVQMVIKCNKVLQYLFCVLFQFLLFGLFRDARSESWSSWATMWENEPSDMCWIRSCRESSLFAWRNFAFLAIQNMPSDKFLSDCTDMQHHEKHALNPTFL